MAPGDVLGVVLGVAQDGGFLRARSSLDESQFRLGQGDGRGKSGGLTAQERPGDGEVGHVAERVFLEGRIACCAVLVDGVHPQQLSHLGGLLVEGALLHALKQGVEEAVVGVQHRVGRHEDRQAFVTRVLIDVPELPVGILGVGGDSHEALPGEYLFLGVRERGPVEVGDGGQIDRLRVEIIGLGERPRPDRRRDAVRGVGGGARRPTRGPGGG